MKKYLLVLIGILLATLCYAQSSQIIVRAQGTLGGENLELRIGGSLIASWTMSTSYQDYTASGSGNVEVHFTNDDQAANGMDIQVDYINYHGTILQAEDQATNTGVYVNNACGGSYSDMLQCNGYILFDTSSLPSGNGSLGDVNGDETINIVDALQVAQHYVGMTPAGFDAGKADVDCNGTINIVDALQIAQLYVGLITQFSCPVTTPVPTPVVTPTPTTGPVGTITGSEVLFIGESFIALSHQIPSFVAQHVRNAGLMASGDNFRDNSVSGMRLAGGGSPTIPQQYANGVQAGPVRYVIMDGGGNDCLGGSCSNPPTSSCTDLQNAVNAARTLLTRMGNDGVKNVIWFWYPDAQQDLGGLQAKLNVLRPMIQQVVESSVNPKCYWLDLRPVFAGKYSQYIMSDGIHPTTAGCQATADAIWNLAQQVNFFQ